jgi:hypothetical protein
MIYVDLILITHFWKYVYARMFVVFRMYKANHSLEASFFAAGNEK